MRRRWITNFDFNSGAVIASPGSVPAQAALGGDGEAGYSYEWVRDGALSVRALITLADSDTGKVGVDNAYEPSMVDVFVAKYLERVEAVLAQASQAELQAEPRFGMGPGAPFVADNWCRPQTDGPGLRALALLTYVDRPSSPQGTKEKAWSLVTQDLDWLATPGNVDRPSCDLWEEDIKNGNLLWNHIVGQRALHWGHKIAAARGEWQKAKLYHGGLQHGVLSGHIKNSTYGPYITECSPLGGGACIARGGDIDGAVILSFIHGGWIEGKPTSHVVANTVRLLTETFCEKFPLNHGDTEAGVAGVLYGRYGNDEYGGGNPWQLITAALASLFYQAAESVAHHEQLTGSDLQAWQGALFPGFDGSAGSFAAAGDAVLTRLMAHVIGDNYQLYEQIDKFTGKQYNAADLTWSYAEVLSALRRRDVALKSMQQRHLLV